MTAAVNAADENYSSNHEEEIAMNNWPISAAACAKKDRFFALVISILSILGVLVLFAATSIPAGAALPEIKPAAKAPVGTALQPPMQAVLPPTISKTFLPDTVMQNGQVLLSFTITNPNSDPNPNVTLTGIQFTDSLPAGLVVAPANRLNGSNCGGTVTADPGSSSISLSGGTIDPQMQLRPQPKSVQRMDPVASGSCFISVVVTATTVGMFNNTTGPISANESGPGAVSNTASLNVTQGPVVAAPTVSKVFGDVSIPVNGTTSLSFTITNPNSTPTPTPTPNPTPTPPIELVNIGLVDPLPSGLVVSTPNGLAGSCLDDGGVVTADPGSTSITLSTLNLPGTASCSFSVNVTGISSGLQNNLTGDVTAAFDDGTGAFQAITGNAASASVVVLVPPSIAKAFNPVIIAPTGVSVVSFTITNSPVNPVSLTGIAFTDTLPANLVVATPSGASGDCNGGTLTAVAGSNTISLSGGTIPVNGSCTVSANVTSAVSGVYNNTVSATSDNAGPGNTASATLTVAPPNLSITKTHSSDFHRRQIGVTYTITVSDSASAGPTLGTVTVTDTLPDVNNTFIPTAIGGTGWTCDLGTLTCTRSDSLAPGASYPPITLTVNVPQNIRANVINSATVSGGEDPNSHTANDPTHIGPPIDPQNSALKKSTLNKSTLQGAQEKRRVRR